MPHVVVKLWPGRNEEIKQDLADTLAEIVAEKLNVDTGDVSVAIEEVAREDWENMVYKPEIKNNPNVYHEPKYEY